MKMKPYLVDCWNRNLYHEWYLLILSISVLLFVTNTIMQYLQFNKSISTTKVFVRSSLGPCYSIQRSSYVILWIQEPATMNTVGRESSTSIQQYLCPSPVSDTTHSGNRWTISLTTFKIHNLHHTRHHDLYSWERSCITLGGLWRCVSMEHVELEAMRPRLYTQHNKRVYHMILHAMHPPCSISKAGNCTYLPFHPPYEPQT